MYMNNEKERILLESILKTDIFTDFKDTIGKTIFNVLESDIDFSAQVIIFTDKTIFGPYTWVLDRDRAIHELARLSINPENQAGGLSKLGYELSNLGIIDEELLYKYWKQ